MDRRYPHLAGAQRRARGSRLAYVLGNIRGEPRIFAYTLRVTIEDAILANDTFEWSDLKYLFVHPHGLTFTRQF